MMSASKEITSMPDVRRLCALYSVKKNGKSDVKGRGAPSRRMSGRLETQGLMQSGERLPQILEERARARNLRSRILPCCGRRDMRNGFLHEIAIPEIFARARGPRQLPS